jgi:hypothetical protein
MAELGILDIIFSNNGTGWSGNEDRARRVPPALVHPAGSGYWPPAAEEHKKLVIPDG